MGHSSTLGLLCGCLLLGWVPSPLIAQSAASARTSEDFERVLEGERQNRRHVDPEVTAPDAAQEIDAPDSVALDEEVGACRRSTDSRHPHFLVCELGISFTGGVLGRRGSSDENMGAGIHLAFIRWVHPHLRLELTVTGLYARSEDATAPNPGLEGGLGGVIMLALDPDWVQCGAGFGVEAVVAREHDHEDGYRGRLGVRFSAVAEFRIMMGMVWQVVPTVTYSRDRLTLGGLFRVGVRFNVFSPPNGRLGRSPN